MAHFTIQDGLQIQAEQLAAWKEVLRDDVYKFVETWATKDNLEAKTGYDIKRGTELDQLVHNWMTASRIF